MDNIETLTATACEAWSTYAGIAERHGRASSFAIEAQIIALSAERTVWLVRAAKAARPVWRSDAEREAQICEEAIDALICGMAA